VSAIKHSALPGERLHVFGGPDGYERGGGLRDYLGGFDNIEDAEATIRQGSPHPFREDKFSVLRWWHIAVVRDGTLVWVAEDHDNPEVP
jgi:hypothetical protein